MLRRISSLKRVVLFLLGVAIVLSVHQLTGVFQVVLENKGVVLGQFVALSQQTIQAKSLLVCTNGGVKRSFLDLFDPLGQESVLTVLNGYRKGMNYQSFMEHSSWEKVKQSLKSGPFLAAYERLISVLDRNSSQVTSVPQKAHSKIQFQNGIEADLKRPESLMNLLSLLAQGGTTNEEDIVINMFHSALNPTWFSVQRLGLINENSCCHVFNVGLDKLNHNTIATILKGHSMGRMVFDFEYYDHGDLSMMPNIRAGVLHSGFGDFYNVQIFPGQSLDLELRAYENQMTSHVSLTLVLARAELIEPNELKRIEMCRLYRQLSRRCQEEDPRRKFLSEKYPNICFDVGDFYIKFQFKECLTNKYALERTHDVKQYIRDNLASITLKIDSNQ